MLLVFAHVMESSNAGNDAPDDWMDSACQYYFSSSAHYKQRATDEM